MKALLMRDVSWLNVPIQGHRHQLAPSRPISFWPVSLCLSAFCLISAESAKAVSFDCAKADQPLDKVICGDAELSKLDDDLATAYGTAKTALSPDGQQILRKGQRDWLSFSRRICNSRLDPKLAKVVDQDAADCLKSEYRERIEDLQHASEKHGRFLFDRVDTYALTKTNPAEPSGRPGFAYQRVSWPRIDKVDDAGIQTVAVWNKTVAALVHKLTDTAQDGSDGAAAGATDSDNSASGNSDGSADGASIDGGSDLDVSYSFGLVTAELISFEISSYEYGHGAAHPNGSSQMQNLFVADGRALTAADLFRSDQDWVGYLTKRSHDGWREILSADGAEATDDSAIDDKAVIDVVKDPQDWLLTTTGISIIFPLYSIGPYVLGEQQIDVTWTELKPYLVDRLPFNLP